jgi:PAS domain-containing protein
MPESTLMKMPALAVVGPDRRIVRSTETFREHYENAEKMCEMSPELDRVLTGRADVATLIFGDLSVEIEAVTDDAGHRQAMLIVPGAEPAPAAEPPVSALQAAAEESPALVWVKDLEGRYLFANRRFVGDLRTSQERLAGKTDRQLAPLETVDGPRLQFAEDGLKEPLQLEYTVPAIDRRPALAVFRFPIRDEHDQPIATCGVAAPVADAQVAHDEMVRLVQLERWNRLDPVAARAEVLEQWHVHAATPRVAVFDEVDGPISPTWDVVAASRPRLAAVKSEAAATKASKSAAARASDPEPPAPVELSEPVSRPTEVTAATPPAPPPTRPPETGPTLSQTAELLQSNLQLARQWADRAEALQEELRQAQARASQAESQAQEAQTAAARAAEEADRWRAELEQAQGELAAARAETESLRGPSSAALELSEELTQAVVAERERGEELEQMLARLRSRLSDLDTAFDQGTSPAPHGVWHGSRRRRQ